MNKINKLAIFAFATLMLAMVPFVAAHQTTENNPIGPLNAIDSNPNVVMMSMPGMNGFHGGHHLMLSLNGGRVLQMFTIDTDDTDTKDHEVLMLASSFPDGKGPRGVFDLPHTPFSSMGDAWVHTNIGPDVHSDSVYYEMAHNTGR